MKRLIAMLSALLLAVAMLPSAATAYFDTPGYEWRPNSFGGVYDLKCDGNHYFEITLYSSENYEGAKLKLCHIEDDFCDIMIADVSIPNSCSGENHGTTWHNVISSFKITMMDGASSSYGAHDGTRCLVFWDPRFYGTQNSPGWGAGKWSIDGKLNVANLQNWHPASHLDWDWNDRFSGLDRVAC